MAVTIASTLPIPVAVSLPISFTAMITAAAVMSPLAGAGTNAAAMAVIGRPPISFLLS